MKRLLFFITIIIALISCSKSGDNNATTHINCDGLVTDTLGTGDDARIYMPTAFTPNADGLNDIVRPIVYHSSTIAFTIYDETNAVVFTTNQVNQGWSTSAVSNTATKYYYKVQVTTAANHKIGQCGELYKLSCIPASIPIASLHFEDQLTQNGFTGITNEHLGTCP